MDLQTYDVIDPVQHDGLLYAPGALIALDTKTAAPLLAVGAIAITNYRSGDGGESPEGEGAAAIAADSAPRTSTADAPDEPPVPAADSAPQTSTADAPGEPPMPPAGATVTPIGAKTKPAKAAPTPAPAQ